MGYSGLMAVALALLIAGTLNAAAAEKDSSSTNKVASESLTLVQALNTNAVGTFKVAPAWTGQCAVVFATGAFKAPESPVFATNRYRLNFDLVVILPKRALGYVGPKAVAMHDTNGGYRSLHTLREALPTDAKLKAVTTQADLERLLGVPHGFPEAAGYGPQPRNRLRWALATANGAAVDTLQVNAEIEKSLGSAGGRVESLEILRGTAQPEIKPPKKS
jgi:hypothetical protein